MHDDRRSFLARTLTSTLASTLAIGSSLNSARPTLAWSNESSTARERIERYLSGLARDDGGYAWGDQQRSHLTTTHAVIGAARLLSLELPHREQLTEFLLTHHPSSLKSLEQEHRLFTCQQIQALQWLGADASGLRETVVSWKKPLGYLKQYEQHGYPVFMQEVSAIVSRSLLGVATHDVPIDYVNYLERHRRDNGSFNNTPASDRSDGNILHTWWGLQAIDVLGRKQELADQLIVWLQKCQLPSGGFTHQPDAKIGAIDDVAYTWAATRALQLLDAQPRERQLTIDHLISLWNDDGGFGDRPGWFSNPVATYYALDTLVALNALDSLNTAVATEGRSNRKLRPRERTTKLPDGLHVYSIQLEAHGQGSPHDAVLLAKSLKIHWWGAKNAKPGWIEQTQSLADRGQVPVRFFKSDEEYGSWMHVDGMGTYSHMSDIIAPTDNNIGQSLANKSTVTWNEFKQQRLAALTAGQGRLVWQFGENEPLVRMLLDDSLERDGFAAISTFHFGNPDFTNSEPFLKRYRGQLPFVALQDAHGTEPWWFADMTEGFRTLFLATEPTWSGFLKALEQNWVIAVRHDAISHDETWMHGGSDETIEFVKQRAADWQWWENPAIQRPAASIALLSSRDQFEVGRPEKGDDETRHVRVRCAWHNTPQGLAKQPMYELIRLSVDGTELSTEIKSVRRPNGLYEDHYYLARITGNSTTPRKLQATLKRLSDQQTLTVSSEY